MRLATATDLAHWQTTIVVDDVDSAPCKVQRHGGRLVSERVVEIDGRRTVLVRDPDGHGLLLTAHGHPTP